LELYRLDAAAIAGGVGGFGNELENSHSKAEYFFQPVRKIR